MKVLDVKGLLSGLQAFVRDTLAKVNKAACYMMAYSRHLGRGKTDGA